MAAGFAAVAITVVIVVCAVFPGCCLYSIFASDDGKFTLLTICSIKRKENFFSLVFFRVLKRAVEKSFFFLSDMKFCFMKRLFYIALEETISVARSEAVRRS
jgi:hypothetical protein